MTALVTDLHGLGTPVEVATYLGEDAKTVPASGTVQLSDGASIAAGNNLCLGFNTVTTSGGATAVQIVSTMPIGRSLFVNVTSATTAAVFPPSGCTLQGQSVNTSIPALQNAPIEVYRVSRTAFTALTSAATGSGGVGTVTSVAYAGDGIVQSSTPTSPVTSSGTLTATLNTQTANRVLAGPATGSPATPTFRALVAADVVGAAVTSITVGTGLTSTPNPIVTTGTITVDETPSLISAAGTIQGDATLIAARKNVVTVGASNAGVRLPATSILFNRTIANYGGNTILVWPNVGGAINGGSANASTPLPNNSFMTLATADGLAWWLVG